MKRRDILNHVRSLGALVDSKSGLCNVPVGDYRSSLQRYASMAAEDEVRFHYFIGIGECLVNLAGIMNTLEGEIVAQQGMNHGRRWIKRRAHISYGFEFFIFDEDGFRGVLGCG